MCALSVQRRTALLQLRVFLDLTYPHSHPPSPSLVLAKLSPPLSRKRRGWALQGGVGRKQKLFLKRRPVGRCPWASNPSLQQAV